MATEAQIAANRLNALRSTGPKTPLGKARSAANAFRHGVYAEGVSAIPHGPFAEDPRVLEAAIEEIAASLQPRDVLEWMQAREVAGLYNQVRRLNEFEAHGLGADTAGHPHQRRLEEIVDGSALDSSIAWNLSEMLTDPELVTMDPEDAFVWDRFAWFVVRSRPEGSPKHVRDLWTEDRVPQDQTEWRTVTHTLLKHYYGDLDGAARWAREFSQKQSSTSYEAEAELMENAARKALDNTLAKTIPMRARLGAQLRQQLAEYRTLAARDLGPHGHDGDVDDDSTDDGQQGGEG